MARKIQGIPVKTARVRVNAEAATHGWTIRADGETGKITDYLRAGAFMRVRYDRFGRIVSVRDELGDKLIYGGDKEGKLRVLLQA